jgi:trimeric autotransporter adhesin
MLMKVRSRRIVAVVSVAVALALTSSGTVIALQGPDRRGRFDALVVPDPTGPLDVATTPLAALPATHAARSGWEQFRAAHGREWSIHLDGRSGAPLLVQGKGIRLTLPVAPTIEGLESPLRKFISANRSLLLADDAELVLDREASGELAPDVWQIVFGRNVAGVPVAGERYLFTVGRGNLISFGSPRWSRIDASPIPDIDPEEAHGRLALYLGLTAADAIEIVEAPELQFIPLRAVAKPYAGPLGSGYASALVWRLAVRVAGEPGTWVGLVDAHSGAIRSFFDDNRYARAKGGIYPASDDQFCPDGCEQPNFPMPFANIVLGSASQTTTTTGSFNCTPGGTVATTTLAGPYVRVVDQCGPISEAVTCSADLDLRSSGGTDCAVPPGATPGNTHAARSGFYHLNRIAEHARTWLPGRVWLTSQLTDRVNLNQTCNAYWNGLAVNFFKSGGGCNNSGELAGVFLHEWGHGLDQNDGGSYDNPTEAYADITSFMWTHASCIGRGLVPNSNCDGYGDACLNCSGVRDQDWGQRAGHRPSTPAGFLPDHCPDGDGPCGKEQHCEAMISGEALWDLAARDLPASGLDQASSWQLADKLWYKSRAGSGGNAYNCALPNSDGCSVSSWFQKLRTVDDDDGNLANGTPHAAAIFAAFDRHKIACGAAEDASNQSTTICPALTAPTLSATAGSASSALAWSAVPGATSYRLLRNDLGCDAGMTRVSLTGNTSLTDAGLANGFTYYYSVQPLVTNAACDGPVSNCRAVTPQPAAGTIALDRSAYGCTDTIQVTVNDSNVGTGTVTATLASTTESAAETVTLTRAAPGAASFIGSIVMTADAPSPDGSLSVADGDLITAKYVDANDGAGHVNLTRTTTAAVDCTPVLPGHAGTVADGTFGTAMTGSRADALGSTIDVTWDTATCASTDYHILYGDLASVASATILGAVCDFGTRGRQTWFGVPDGDLWFVVVGDDGAATEGSWGTDGIGGQRGGPAVSGRCGLTTRDNSGVCP